MYVQNLSTEYFFVLGTAGDFTFCVTFPVLKMTTNYCCKNIWASYAFVLHFLLRFPLWCSKFAPPWISTYACVNYHLMLEGSAQKEWICMTSASRESVGHLTHLRLIRLFLKELTLMLDVAVQWMIGKVVIKEEMKLWETVPDTHL